MKHSSQSPSSANIPATASAKGISKAVTGKTRPTLKSIAELTGLGVTTVSRALKDAPELAQATKDRVKAVATEIGYRPDRAGVGLRTGKTHVISLVLNQHEEVTGYGSSMIFSITQLLTETPFDLVVTPNLSTQDPLKAVRAIVESGSADGILLSRTQPMDQRIRYLLEQDFPFVSHGRTELSTPHPFYDYDNRAFAAMAAQRFTDRGRTCLAMIPPQSHLTFYTHLQQGFTSTAEKANAQLINLPNITLDSSPEEIRAVGRSLRHWQIRPDAILCCGEISAIALIAGLEDSGLTVGQDIDVIAKQTSHFFDYTMPRIDTIYEDIAETGRKMTQTLLKSIDRQSQELQDYQILQQPQQRFRL